MESKLELRNQLDLYNNPFELAFSVAGSEIEKRCFIMIGLKDEEGYNVTFFQGKPFETKVETVKDLEIILRVALFECEKVRTVADYVGPGNNGRYLNLYMVEQIISALSQKDTWSLYTGTKDWKKKFLIIQDGLVEGQRVSLTYLSGDKKGKTVERVLSSDIKPTYAFQFKGELIDANVVLKVEKRNEGSFLVETREYNCSIVIVEE